MEPRDYVAALRKSWLLILLVAIVGAGSAYGYAKSSAPSYRATSKVFVTVENGQTVSELVQGSTFAQNVVQSYAQLVTMPAVLDSVIEELGLGVTSRSLARSVSANTPLNTSIIEIGAVSGDPDRAAEISNAVATSLSATVDELAPRNAEGGSSVAVRTVSPAVAPEFAFWPNTRFLTATGLLVGLVLGIGGALLRQVLDTKVRREEDVARVTDMALLGSVAASRTPESGRPVMLSRPRSAQAESYRKIRANLQFVNAAIELRSLAVTSARASEGKSTTVLNLALAMAERSSRVLIVDADLRRPTIAEKCGLEGAAGLTTVLIGNAGVDDVIQCWGDTGVSVMAAGAAPPNPLQLLESEAMAELLEELKERYDAILFDAPPALPVADASVLGRLADGVLLVAGAGMVTRQQLRTVVDSLGAVGTEIVGVVLSRANKREISDYYGYGYHSDEEADKPEPAGNSGASRSKSGKRASRRSRRAGAADEGSAEAEPDEPGDARVDSAATGRAEAVPERGVAGDGDASSREPANAEAASDGPRHRRRGEAASSPSR